MPGPRLPPWTACSYRRSRMMTALPDGLAVLIEEDHSVLNDFMRGNPERAEISAFQTLTAFAAAALG
jgi:hypothetical protein